MKLLLITQKVDADDFYFSFFIPWLKLMAGKFERLELICLEEGEHQLPANVRVHSLGKEKKAGKLRELIRFYYLIIKLSADYEAVFVHMNPIWVVLGGIYWRLAGKKIFLWYTHKSVTFRLRLAEILADRIFTASKESFRFTSNKVIVTGHGVDTDLFRPGSDKKNNECLKILAGGRIAPVKRYETLIRAARLLADKGVKFNVQIFGQPILEADFRYQKELKELVEREKLNDKIQFIGKMRNESMPALYRENDIFVHLSRTGSLDKVILEAMACGIFVLSSNDSSKAFLPPAQIFDDEKPTEVAEKIMANAYVKPDPALREYVAKNHSLRTLIEKIYGIICST